MEQNVSCHFFGFTLPKSWRSRHEFRADVVVGTPDFPPPTSASGRRDSSAPCRWSCDGSSGTYFSLCRDSKPRLASCRSSSLPPNFHSGWNVSNEGSRTFQSLWWFSRLRDVVTMDTSEVWFEPGLIWANVELRWKTFSSAEVFLTMTGVDSRLREVLADPGSSENQRYKIFKSCSLFE